MSKQKVPNVYNTDMSNFGLVSPAGKDETGKNYDQAGGSGNVNGYLAYNKVEKFLNRKKLISNAQVLALNATPVAVIPAPGAGYFIKVNWWTVIKPAGTAYGGVAAGEDLVLKYTDGSGAICAAAVETTGFLDQATAQTRHAGALAGSGAAASTPADFTPVANAAVVLHLLSGEVTTGTSPLYILVDYDIIPSDFVATA